MKHADDPGTLELDLPKKRGRPTLYTSALTPAERARRYRRRKADRFDAAWSDPAGAETGILCQALAWLAANPDAVSERTAQQLGWKIAKELARRFPSPAK
ncbi:hypothetical protein K4L06_17960 [Lysobacter sp. BMK333-48F3]|uniref:hypothetical protein n=1 Tax=Lysobacter sp. BMK333-48F3 TaxID=2867962 RepID=UPI001C8C6BCD|nr:hypothetical protein [Lysobacter sp. BMK333-48F3]MBX9403199.1 hypothetical protein [Lysobacter sp. BMK333-48F3]